MAGATDLVVLTIPLDTALSEYQLSVGRSCIVVNKLDGPFRWRIGGPSADQWWVENPLTFIATCNELVDVIYLTAAAVPGGIIQLVCTNGSGVGLP